MKITYDLTKKDAYKGLRYFTYKSKTGKKQMWRIYLSCFVIFLIIDIFSWLTDPVDVLEVIIQIILDLFFLLVITNLFILVQIRFFLSKGKGVLGEHTVELEDAGLRELTEYNDSLERWNAIDEILQNNEGIYFIYHNSILAVPHRFFTSREEANKFYELACQYRKEYQP